MLASGSRDNTARLWSVAEGKLLQVLSGHKDTVSAVAFAADDRSVLSAGWDKTVVLGNETPLFIAKTSILAMAVSAGRVLTGGQDGRVTLWSEEGKQVREWAANRSEVYSVGFSPDGKFALTAGRDGAIKIWDVANGSEVRAFPAGGSYVSAAAFSGDGKRIASASGDQKVRVWNAATGAEIEAMDLASTLNIPVSVAFTAEGSVLAGTDRGVIVRLTMPPSTIARE